MNCLSSAKAGKPEVSARLIELRKMIHDETYLDSAIHRIAQVLSRKLVENHEVQRK